MRAVRTLHYDVPMPRRTYNYRPSRVPPGALRTMRPARRSASPRLLLALFIVVLLGMGAYAGIRSITRLADRNAPSTRPSAEATAAPSTVLAEQVALAYPTYLGGPRRDSGGRGPAPEALDLVWKLQIGSGRTARTTDDKLVTWSGTGWTGQPTLTYVDGHPWHVIGG
jgi:hypothetical protein